MTNVPRSLLLLFPLLLACGSPPPARVPRAAAVTTAPDKNKTPKPRRQRRIERDDLRQIMTSAGLSPDEVQCSTFVYWEPSLNNYAKAIVNGLAQRWGVKTPQGERREEVHYALGYLVRLYFEQARPDNLGGMRLKGRTYQAKEGGARRPLMVFRSGLTLQAGGGPSTCFQSLIKAAGVRHVVNLYAGSFPFHDLIDGEKAQARALGADYFDLREHSGLRWRSLVEEEHAYLEKRGEAQRRMAKLIRDQILQPGGAPPRGNIYFHCAGGMHRSGMLFGVLRRCLNGAPMEAIEAEYRRHVGYVSDQEPGGYEPLNLRFIREYDCSLLKDK